MVKVTCRKRDTFIIAGIAFKAGKFDGVYLGRREGRRLVYAGKVENGFSEQSQKQIREHAASLKSTRQPFTEKVQKPKAQWLRPALKGDVKYRTFTSDGKLRHPSFKGLREDLPD